jgi:lysozyme family protein
MGKPGLHRRDFVRFAGGASVIALAGTSAFAQSNALADLLDKLPKEVLDILPAKPVNLARTISTIMRLEKEADAKRLPLSILSFKAGEPIVATEATLYKAAVPRLVTLIDRSEGDDPAMADEAGAILADINASQHEVPEALKPAPPVALPPAPAAAPPVNIPLSRNRDYASLKSEYARLFSTLEVREDLSETAGWYLTMMKKARTRYEAVGKDLGVPWFFIAATHGLEASFNFRAHLHNGDYPLTARTRQVPAGRPTVWLPPADWESSAKDALKLLGFANQPDWSLERTLYRLEAYNGFGYRRRGVATPYLWSYSNHYDRGKFVADGTWNAKARSQQCGAAVMIKMLAEAGEIPSFAAS